MFSVFILSCGLTHVMGIWVVWNGTYGAQGLMKAGTALASVATALMLFPVVPKLLALRTPAELAEANEALQDEIVQREATEKKTRELREELAHVARVNTLGQLGANIAHELNQPLVAMAQNVDAALTTLKQSKSADPELTEILTDIEEQSQRAGRIIKATRDFVSKETGVATQVDINALIDQTIMLIEPDAKMQNIEIKNSMQKLPMIQANRIQLAQVLVNLLRNAIDAIVSFNPRERRIIVSTKFESNQVVLSVDDSGAGVDTGIKLFQPFETNKSEGMGLGLSISKSIIEAHGGTMWLADTGELSGASFTIALPLDLEAAQ